MIILVTLTQFFFYFQKAFHLVSRDKLLCKLKHTGLPSFIINWISAYLGKRTPSVSTNGRHSRSLSVTSGLPQGSVLVPLLFFIFINDIVNVITKPVQIRLFTDDCILYHEVVCPDDPKHLNTNLHNVHSWCKQWDTNLNEIKTVYMHITKKIHQRLFSYSLPANPLVEVNECTRKYLRMTITNNLSWNSHIANICASSFRKFCIL